jgi:hypothetical protein
MQVNYYSPNLFLICLAMLVMFDFSIIIKDQNFFNLIIL